MTEDWFRSPGWDDDARGDYERRLARARPHNRPQYLKIKALALRDAGQPEAAAELLHRALETPGVYAFEAAHVTELLGDLRRQAGGVAGAERLYRQLLADGPSPNGTSGSITISLAELLIEHAPGDQAAAEAAALLKDWENVPQLQFDSQLFRWHVAHARLALRVGDHDLARRSAGVALELSARGPQLPRHPTVGLVVTDDNTLAWLQGLLTPDPGPRKRWSRPRGRPDS